MFGFDQRQRLMREEGWTADGLAQELYAMFGEFVPNNTQAPVVINQSPEATVAPIQIGNFEPGKPIFGLTNKDGSDGGNISIVEGNWVITQNGQTTKIC